MRRLDPQRRYSTGPSYPATSARGGDENAPPPDDGFDAAAPFTLGPKGPGAASSRRSSFHFSAVRPPLASSSRYNGKPQLPAAPTTRNGSEFRAAWNAPARPSVARTSSPAPPPTKRLRKSSAEILGSKCVPVAPTNQESCSDEGFLSLELEWGIHKTILVEELKSSIEACKQKEAMIYTLEFNLSELIHESNGLEKINVKSQELLKERDMEILKLNSELEKARKDQRDHVSTSFAEQEKDYVSRQVEFHTEVIASLATEQVSIKEQLAEIELLLDESMEATLQKEVIAQSYASLVMDMKEEIHRLESQLEQSKSCHKGTAKELEIMMQELNKEKEIRKTHVEEKNGIFKKNKILEISVEDFKDTMYSLEERVYSLEKKANKFEEEAQLQRWQREKIEVELHILRQQSLVVRSSEKAESSSKDEMADLADSIRVPSYRSYELLCSQESQRICRKEVSDKESVVPGEDDSDLEILDGPPSNFVTRKKKRAVKVKQRIDGAFLRRSKRVAQKAEGLKDAESARKFKEGKKEKKPKKPKDTKKGTEGGAEASEPISLAMITPTGKEAAPHLPLEILEGIGQG